MIASQGLGLGLRLAPSEGTWSAIGAHPIVAWGDSLTAGVGAGVPSQKIYPKAAASRLNVLTSAIVRGVGAQSSTQVAARQGGRPVFVTVAGDQIPGSGPVALTAKSINVLFASGSFQGTIAGTIAGVAGMMSTDAAGNWTFTRTTAGATTAVAPGTQFVLDEAVAFRDATQWILAGSNNIASVAVVLEDIAAMVEHAGHGRFRVISPLPGSDWTTEAIAACHEVIAGLAAAYGTRFVDALAALQAANDGSAGDLADVAAGVTPRSLRFDSIHLNGKGYDIVGAAVARSYPAADRTLDLGLATGWGEFDSADGWTVGAGWSFSNGRLLRDTSAGSQVIRTVPELQIGTSYRAIVRGYHGAINVRNGAQFLTMQPDDVVKDFVATATTFGFQGGGIVQELLNVSLIKLGAA